MNANQSSSEYPRTGLAGRRSRSMATKLALGMLATTLIATAALPAFAAKPDHQQHGDHHAQRQEQGVNASGKRRGNKSKTVKKTFTSNGAIAIPVDGADFDFGPADPYPSTIAVSGFKKAKITDVNLTLRGFSHTFPADLDVLLVAPGDRNALLFSDVGRDPDEPAVTNITLKLDDEAATALPAEDILTDGSFRPLANRDPSGVDFPAPAPVPNGSVALSTFDGIAPNGEWRLFIVDEGQEDVGRLSGGWDLEITAKNKAKGKGKGKKQR